MIPKVLHDGLTIDVHRVTAMASEGFVRKCIFLIGHGHKDIHGQRAKYSQGTGCMKVWFEVQGRYGENTTY